MDKQGSPLQRHLAHLKVLSRLLGHELHAQGSAKQVTFSRDQVMEIQTSLDLFIEDAGRRVGSASGASSAPPSIQTAGETHLLPTRN